MPHGGPRTNGEVPRTTPPSRTALLPDICYTLRRKVTAFLEQPSDDQLVRATQAQARVAMGVIEEALQSYT
jgi:FAD synthetase